MLNAVPQAGIAPLWGWIKEGLEQAQAKCQSGWSVEDVRRDLVLGKAQLFTWGHDDGFCVLERIVLDGVPVLFIRALWGPGDHEACHEAIHADLDRIAKDIGAARIRIQGRRGWARKGFRVVDTIMEREVW
jgi:hypothetical protein